MPQSSVLPIASPATASTPPAKTPTAFYLLAAVSFCHLMNDTVQSLLPSIYPILKTSLHLNFTQIGIVTLTYQFTASILQPFIGHFSDRKPRPYTLQAGMLVTLAGLLLLATASGFLSLLAAAALVGAGSAIFHPESSRVAQLASGGKHGLAQSFFQVGGSAGAALGPLAAAFIILPTGQSGIAWFAFAAILGFAMQNRVGAWYSRHLDRTRNHPPAPSKMPGMSRRKVLAVVGILLVLIFAKHFYLASINSYYTFYLMQTFNVSLRGAQIHLFAFLAAVAAGILVGGPLGDRIGRKPVIWISFLGAFPFTLALPYSNLFWTGIFSVVIGFVIASAFSAILVYAQELVPGRIGTISGLFFGFAFGMGGIGAAVFGKIADMTSLAFVYKLCAWLPAVGLLTLLLPSDRKSRPGKA